MRRDRGHFLTGFVVTLGFALAAILIYAAYVLYVKEPALVPAIPDAGVRSPKPKPPPSTGDADKQALLATQSAEKRNQILVIDLFLQILGRYPDASEQAEWLTATSPHGKALAEMRRRGDSDAVIANHVAGTLLQTAAESGRVPLIRAPASGRRRGAEPRGDGAAYVGAMIARGLGPEPGAAASKDEVLVRGLERQFGLPPDGEARLGTVVAMLQEVTSSTDVVPHLRTEGTSLDVELDAIRTALRAGRFVAVNGADSKSHSRYVLLIGFDERGDFLVRDPMDRMTLRIAPAVLQAFLQKPGLWIDVPGKRGHSRPGAPSAALPGGLESLVLEPPASGMTGVIPGARENLTPSRIPPGEHTMRGTLSMTADQIDRVLAAAKSPAAGTGPSFVRWGRYYNVDPAWALAFFRRESAYGTAPKWVGRINDELTTKNIGDLRYTASPSALGEPGYAGFSGFREYATWDDGIHDWFKLVAEDSRYAGLHTVERVLPVYAPPFENDLQKYLGDVVTWVEEWRSESRAELASHHLQPP